MSLDHVLCLLPAPQQLKYGNGDLNLADKGLIVIDGGNASEISHRSGGLLRAALERQHLDWTVVATSAGVRSETCLISLIKNTSNAHSQLYTLKIEVNKITINSSGEEGLYYGARTLAQIIGQYGRSIPCLEITDWPDFSNRGVMLDISRDKVYRMETLYALVDRLASIKINQIQLYTEHTFAYQRHPEVWKNASPMTGEEILALDRYCQDYYIQLVPNQNSFGHMHRWLNLPEYADLAEIQGEFEVPWGTMRGPFSLAPEEPGSFELISSLYDELLPHFSSKIINIGCDETFDLGAGKSKQLCANRGTGQVYLDFLLRLYSDLKQRGYQLQFWGDIILHHPDLVAKLPEDMIALEWGYEAKHPFAEHAKAFRDSEIPFYVCPGTSAWNSIAGRTENALTNLRLAAEQGKLNGAVGYLNTDWGDGGHWQVLPVSYLGFAAGAAYSWCVNANQSVDLREAISIYMFEDPSGSMGRLVHALGDIYSMTEMPYENASALNHILHVPLETIAASGQVKAEALVKIIEAVKTANQELVKEEMACADASTIRSEMSLTAKLLIHACQRGLYAIGDGQAPDRLWLMHDLEEILKEYQRIWLLRNRVGGLKDSIRTFEEMMVEYQGH